MSMIVLRRLRIWLVFLAAINLILVMVEYSWWVERDTGRLRWGDWTIIITAVVFFAAYIHSLKGKPFMNKFLRAFLLFVCTILLIYLGFSSIAMRVRYPSPFECTGSPICYVYLTYTFSSIIFGFFALFEIALTLKNGPLQPKTQAYGLHGYGDQANVVIVSPDQPQGYHPAALQQPAMISHQQNHHYSHYAQYPQHQFTHAAPPLGGYMIEIQEQKMGYTEQMLPQQQTYQQPLYGLPPPPTTTLSQQHIADNGASSLYAISGHQQSPVNASGQPLSPQYPLASSTSPQSASTSALAAASPRQ